MRLLKVHLSAELSIKVRHLQQCQGARWRRKKIPVKNGGAQERFQQGKGGENACDLFHIRELTESSPLSRFQDGKVLQPRCRFSDAFGDYDIEVGLSDIESLERL